jgi:hypothetical protein
MARKPRMSYGDLSTMPVGKTTAPKKTSAAKQQSKLPKVTGPKTPAGPTQYGSMRTPSAPPPRGRFSKGGMGVKKGKK